MKRIVLGVLAAWAGIVALAWWLVERRIEQWPYHHELDGERDAILIAGLVIPLGLFVLALFMGLVRLNRRRQNPPASRELRR